MTLTSSEILKRLEKDAFAIHIKQKRIEALMAEVSSAEANMLDTARSLYSDENLVQAAIMMAQMSIPALEEKATRILNEGAQSLAVVSQPSGGEVPGYSEHDDSENLHDSDEDPANTSMGDDDGTVEDPQRSELDRINEEEFFSVDVPGSQLDLARMIKYEAAVSVKQNTKNNTYATDRGKNAWRKLLFTRARAEYLKNGVPFAAGGEAHGDVTINEVEVEAVELSAIEVDQIATPAIIDQTASSATAPAVVEDDAPTEFEKAEDLGDVDDDPLSHGSHDMEEDHLLSADIAEQDHHGEPVGEPGSSADERDILEDDDVHLEDAAAISSVASFDEIPFFDDPAVVSGEVSTASDDDTLFVDDTAFKEDSEDDGHHLDPIVLEDESPHDDHSDPVHDDSEIEPPEFDPDAELFDDKPASSSKVEEVVEAASSVAKQDAAPATSSTVHPRAVSVDSIPAHMRPGAPRVPSAPARHGHSAPSPRVVSGQPSVSQQGSGGTPAPQPEPEDVAVAKPSPANPPVVPTRQAPGRSSPGTSASPSAPARTHGYGAKVPAPDGLEQAIRERDAAASAKAAPQPAAATPSAPPRPGAAPSRPLPFTKPNFGR